MNLRLSWKLWTFMNSWRTFKSRGGGRRFLLNLTAFSFLTHYGPLSQALKRRFLHSIRGSIQWHSKLQDRCFDHLLHARLSILCTSKAHPQLSPDQLSFGQFPTRRPPKTTTTIIISIITPHWGWEYPSLASFLPAGHPGPPPSSAGKQLILPFMILSIAKSSRTQQWPLLAINLSLFELQFSNSIGWKMLS